LVDRVLGPSCNETPVVLRFDAKAFAERAVAKYASYRCGDRRVVGRIEATLFRDEFVEWGDVRADDGRRAGHCFDDRQAVSLGPTRNDCELGGLSDRDQVVVCDESRDDDACGSARRLGEMPVVIGSRAVHFAGDDELGIADRRSIEREERSNERFVVLSRM
jgi:hypothetical protein